VTEPEQASTAAGGFRGGVVERLAPRALGRDFRWLWSASTVTNLGDGALLAAGPLLVTTITREPFAIAASVFLQQLPWVLIGIPAGAFIDRHDRRRLSILVNLLRTLVLGGLALTVATETVSLPVIFVAVFLIGTAETFADNAGSALVATTVPKPSLGVANARLSGTNIVTNQLLGPPLGAFLFAFAMAFPFALDAVCALAGAVLVSRIASRPAPAVAREDRHLRREIADGMRWLWRHPPIRALFLTILLFNVTFGAAMSVFVLLAKERLGLEDVGYGLLITVGAIGGLIGSAAYGRLERRFSLATLMRAGLALETVTHLILATSTSALVVGATMLLFGIHEIVWGTTSTTVRQRTVPTRLMGRVTSVYMLGLFGGTVVGGLIGGVIAQAFGVTAPFWFAFIGSAALLAVIWRTLEDIAHAPAAEDELVP
jgi:MFS family permease